MHNATASPWHCALWKYYFISPFPEAIAAKPAQRPANIAACYLTSPNQPSLRNPP